MMLLKISMDKEQKVPLLLLKNFLFRDKVRPVRAYSYKLFMQMHDIESLKYFTYFTGA